jgi:biotin-dependent carboxylase-like uncharacterized protein
MTIRIIRAGMQTTVQAGPRVGLRHLGVPACGAADPLSLALANRLVGNDLQAPAIEATLAGVSLRFESPADFALTGASARAELNDAVTPFHETLTAVKGDELHITAPDAGARVYVAIAGGLVADEVLGSTSTYLPAALGGHKGRALLKDDCLEIRPTNARAKQLRTPPEFRPPITRSWAFRACRAGETSFLADQGDVFDANFTVGNRADRMGMMLEGHRVEVSSQGRMPSAPVFPGTLQCPEGGQPFMLSIDAQTTGGYPRVAQVARVDRHLLGQIRPGDKVRLLLRDEQSAIDELRAKVEYWEAWLPGASAVI